jgi:enhancing lycopene biosynthesis protein 2
MMNKRFAVILTGCGHLDGAEIRESVLTLLSLDAREVDYDIFAPNQDQLHAVNHLSQEEEKSTRNVLDESARIARGKVLNLNDLDPDKFSGLLIPGGFGVAKNLCDFALKGSSASVTSKAREIVESFYSNKKPIGAICIAPALIALILGKHGVELTIGTDAETATEIEKTGARHINCDQGEFHLDTANKIATTPAYMFDDTKLHVVQKGIDAVVENVIKWS